MQGDIFSPCAFIFAVAMIMMRHGVRCIHKAGSESSANVLSKLLKMLADLGYADDIGLIDEDAESASERVTCIEEGSLTDADMVISRPKAEVMHVREQSAVSPARAADYADLT